MSPIDGRSLGDILDYIHRYARQVIFHDLKKDERGEEYVELSNWLAFFEESLPFRMSGFAKIDFDQVEDDLKRILEAVENAPTKELLHQLLQFAYTELIAPIQKLQKATTRFEFGFSTYLASELRNSLVPPLKRHIILAEVPGSLVKIN